MAISIKIQNDTGSTVGPYNGQSIAANALLTVTSQISAYAVDTNLISDILNDVVTVTIGSVVFSEGETISMLQALGEAEPWSYSNLTGNATTTVKSGAGVLHGIIINNNTTGGLVKVYDNTAGSGTLIATITVGSPSGGLLSSAGDPGSAFMGPLDLAFNTGLTVVTSGSSSNNITALWQ